MNRAVETLLTVHQIFLVSSWAIYLRYIIDCPTPHSHTEIEPFTSCIIILVQYSFEWTGLTILNKIKRLPLTKSRSSIFPHWPLMNYFKSEHHFNCSRLNILFKRWIVRSWVVQNYWIALVCWRTCLISESPPFFSERFNLQLLLKP